MQSDIALLAINQLRRDWPYMASLLDDMRTKAQSESEGGAADSRRPAPLAAKAQA